MRFAGDSGMTKNTEQWHRKLDERAAELESELRTAKADEAEAPTRTPHVQVPDTVDAAEERLRGALRSAEMDRDVAELRDIEAARERLRNGEFGTCVDCGAQIPAEGLTPCRPPPAASNASSATNARIRSKSACRRRFESRRARGQGKTKQKKRRPAKDAASRFS